MPGLPKRVQQRYVRIPKPQSDGNTELHAYWHSRGYIPHHENWERLQMVTFRLGNALPANVVQRLANEDQSQEGEANYRRRIESLLDAGHGACWLQRTDIAHLLEKALQHNDGRHYHLHAWVIMPNHVHVLVEPLSPFTLSTIVRDWKSFTAREINHLLKRTGPLWQEDYWDRYIRDEKHYHDAIRYILENPVKAHLAQTAGDWRFCYLKQAPLPENTPTSET